MSYNLNDSPSHFIILRSIFKKLRYIRQNYQIYKIRKRESNYFNGGIDSAKTNRSE